MNTFEFEGRVEAIDAVVAVQSEGACAIHDFISPAELERAAYELSFAAMVTDDETSESQVQRHHDLVQYDFSVRHAYPMNLRHGASAAPQSVYDTARTVATFIRDGDPTWQPNEIMGHRYNRGDYIAKHRDYASALGYVAVLTLQGAQEFYFQRDNESMAKITMEPGTLTILRGEQTTGGTKRRPFHGVERAKEKRLAISLRHMRDMTWD